MGGMFDKLGDLLKNKILDEEKTVCGELAVNEENFVSNGNSECEENSVGGKNFVNGENTVCGKMAVNGENSVSDGNSVCGENSVCGGNSVCGENSACGENSVSDGNFVSDGNSGCGEKKIKLKDILLQDKKTVGEVVKADCYTNDIPVKIINADVTFNNSNDDK